MFRASFWRSVPPWLAISSGGAITPAGSVATGARSSAGTTGETDLTTRFGKQNTLALRAHIDQVTFDGELIGCNN
jgi:hypothetical protein